MSWSLKIQNGDLAVDSSNFGIVTGQQKLVQDLADWILTRMGTDMMNPTYGSTVDGGIRPNGVIVPSLIGQPMDTLALESELRRIVSDYQTQQLARSQYDRATWNKTTLSADEIVISLDGIDFNQIADKLTATLFITTAVGNKASVNLDLPVA